jgi:hypothetical protein
MEKLPKHVRFLGNDDEAGPVYYHEVRDWYYHDPACTQPFIIGGYVGGDEPGTLKPNKE